jgi:hypothetical protein
MLLHIFFLNIHRSYHSEDFKMRNKNLKEDMFLPDTTWKLQERKGREGRFATQPGT